MSKRRIIDKRKKEKYMLDDAYLNGMARLCGWQGTIVYNSLCRHASKDQTCFPSLQLMSQQHGVSKPTILKGIKLLEERCVIQVNKTRSNGGKWLNNEYVLLDKSEWKYDQVNEVDTVNQVNVATPPSQRGLLGVVKEVDTKETHSKETHIKETHIGKQSLQEEIVSVIDEFKLWNSAAKRWYANKTQRQACSDLIEELGLDRTLQMVKSLPKINRIPYVTSATTPLQLFNKYSTIEAQLNKAALTNKEKENKYEII